MSALTENNKKEIEEQYRKWKEKREKKVLLTIFFNLPSLKDGPDISFRIIKSIYESKKIESATYNPGTNVVTIIAKWDEPEIPSKIDKIRSNPEVYDVNVKILTPLF